jgi:4-amino-4-deoxy-L-arabinose transferase-like glycosyltransferase
MPWRQLLPVAALYLAVTGCWLVAIPPFEGPDELQHYDYARYVAYYGHLPNRIPATLNEGGWFTVQWVQEGAYYWTLGQMLRVAGAASEPPRFVGNLQSRWNGGVEANLLRHDTPVPPALVRGVLVGRLFAMLFGLGTLLCVFAAVHAYTGRARIAALAATSVALIPEFGVHHVLVTNDPAAACLASVASLLLVRWYMRPSQDSWRLPAAAGAVTGLALATKLTAGFLLLLAPLLFWAKSRADRAGARAGDAVRGPLRLWPLASVWAIALLATGAWNFIRNWRLFGDPLATALKQTLVAQHGNPVHFQPGELSSYQNLLHVLFHGFWVSVGWTDWGPDAFGIWLFYGVLTILLLLAIGAAIAVAASARTQPRRRGLLRVLLLILALHTIAFVVALANTPGYSMRYYLPLTVPLVVLVTAGLQWLRARAVARVGVTVVRWTFAGLVACLAIAWLSTFGDALFAFRIAPGA